MEEGVNVPGHNPLVKSRVDYRPLHLGGAEVEWQGIPINAGNYSKKE